MGFPIRKSTDIMSADDSPLLIAVYRVLLRLLAPRHPPRALMILFSGLLCCQSSVWFRSSETTHTNCTSQSGLSHESLTAFDNCNGVIKLTIYVKYDGSPE